ncbi:aminotransferase class I/II-fold pyridoxal phosphate-dependent enzyme [Micromonospora sp. NPDC023644]|uniref:aminotransferase class I/II-fold pyridoxal phosphate-dependent enzyme n=1 Tax=Micromonospora sp. NPDC023644 TaxID=3154321 RepID=UPI0033C14DA2
MPRAPEHVRRLFARCLAESATDMAWETPPPEGDDDLREALAGWLGERPEHVVVTCSVRGTVTALGHGRRLRVAVEAPTFRGVVKALRAAGHEVHLVAGGNVAELSGYDAVWFTSPGRNPDGRTVSPATWPSHRPAGLLVQNEIYRPWGGHVALPGATAVGSFSKLAGGGVRLGWLRGPGAQDVAAASPPGLSPPAPWQRAWSRFIRYGGLAELAAHVVAASVAAREAFLGEIAERYGQAAPAVDGPSVTLVDVGGALPVPALIARLSAAGVRVADGAKFELPVPGVRATFFDQPPDEARRAARIVAEVSGGSLRPMVWG